MRLLLDTHTLIWALGFSGDLPQSVRRLLTDPRNQVYASAVNIFEVASKRVVTRRSSPEVASERLLRATEAAGYPLLPVTPEHAVAVEGLATFHGDPFDRLLLAQAQVEGLQLVTHDERLAQYDSRTILF